MTVCSRRLICGRLFGKKRCARVNFSEGYLVILRNTDAVRVRQCNNEENEGADE